MYRTVRGWLGAGRRRLRSRLAGALHERRRADARARLASLREVRSILVVCLGNVCRSPYAAARLRALTGGSVDVASCGFIGPGRASPAPALEEARRRGMDLEGHESRRVTREALARSDLVVLVDPAHRRRLARIGLPPGVPVVVLGDLDPWPVESRAIPDPWGKGPEVFEAVFGRIDRCARALVEALP